MTDAEKELNLRTLVQEFMAAWQCSEGAAQHAVIRAGQYLHLDRADDVVDHLDALEAEARAASHGVGLSRAQFLHALATVGVMTRLPLAKAAFEAVLKSPIRFTKPETSH